MADVVLRSATPRGKSIGVDDLVFGADPNQTDASVAFKADLVSEFIATVFQNPPSSLTEEQATALRTLIGATLGDLLTGFNALDLPGNDRYLLATNEGAGERFQIQDFMRNFLESGSVLANNTDLDDVYMPGVYQLDSDNSYTNKPSADFGGSVLVSHAQNSGDSSTRVIQLALGRDDNALTNAAYIRYGTLSSGGDEIINTRAWSSLIGGSGGLTSVTIDSDHLSGDGTADSPLSIATGGVGSDELDNTLEDLLLPTLPAEGSRDNRVPKFDGDTLGWELDATSTGGSGISESDARNLIADWAETDNDDDVPSGKTYSPLFGVETDIDSQLDTDNISHARVDAYTHETVTGDKTAVFTVPALTSQEITDETVRGIHFTYSFESIGHENGTPKVEILLFSGNDIVVRTTVQWSHPGHATFQIPSGNTDTSFSLALRLTRDRHVRLPVADAELHVRDLHTFKTVGAADPHLRRIINAELSIERDARIAADMQRLPFDATVEIGSGGDVTFSGGDVADGSAEWTFPAFDQRWIDYLIADSDRQVNIFMVATIRVQGRTNPAANPGTINYQFRFVDSSNMNRDFMTARSVALTETTAQARVFFNVRTGTLNAGDRLSLNAAVAGLSTNTGVSISVEDMSYSILGTLSTAAAANNLTTAQVESSISSDFGLVSGERLHEAIEAQAPPILIGDEQDPITLNAAQSSASLSATGGGTDMASLQAINLPQAAIAGSKFTIDFQLSSKSYGGFEPHLYVWIRQGSNSAEQRHRINWEVHDNQGSLTFKLDANTTSVSLELEIDAGATASVNILFSNARLILGPGEIEGHIEAVANSAVYEHSQSGQHITHDERAKVAAIPVGGTTGQALIKTSGTDYDTQWGDVSSGGGGGGGESDFEEIYDGFSAFGTGNRDTWHVLTKDSAGIYGFSNDPDVADKIVWPGLTDTDFYLLTLDLNTIKPTTMVVNGGIIGSGTAPISTIGGTSVSIESVVLRVGSSTFGYIFKDSSNHIILLISSAFTLNILGMKIYRLRVPGGEPLWTQYSADGTDGSWHNTLVPATDKYIRFATAASRPADSSDDWSEGVQFVGDDGGADPASSVQIPDTLFGTYELDSTFTPSTSNYLGNSGSAVSGTNDERDIYLRNLEQMLPSGPRNEDGDVEPPFTFASANAQAVNNGASPVGFTVNNGGTGFNTGDRLAVTPAAGDAKGTGGWLTVADHIGGVIEASTGFDISNAGSDYTAPPIVASDATPGFGAGTGADVDLNLGPFDYETASEWVIDEACTLTFTFTARLTDVNVGGSNAARRWFTHLEYSKDGGVSWQSANGSDDSYDRVDPDVPFQHIVGQHTERFAANERITFRWHSQGTDASTARITLDRIRASVRRDAGEGQTIAVSRDERYARHDAPQNLPGENQRQIRDNIGAAAATAIIGGSVATRPWWDAEVGFELSAVVGSHDAEAIVNQILNGQLLDSARAGNTQANLPLPGFLRAANGGDRGSRIVFADGANNRREGFRIQHGLDVDRWLFAARVRPARLVGPNESILFDNPVGRLAINYATSGMAALRMTDHLSGSHDLCTIPLARWLDSEDYDIAVLIDRSSGSNWRVSGCIHRRSDATHSVGGEGTIANGGRTLGRWITVGLDDNTASDSEYTNSWEGDIQDIVTAYPNSYFNGANLLAKIQSVVADATERHSLYGIARYRQDADAIQNPALALGWRPSLVPPTEVVNHNEAVQLLPQEPSLRQMSDIKISTDYHAGNDVVRHAEVFALNDLVVITETTGLASGFDDTIVDEASMLLGDDDFRLVKLIGAREAEGVPGRYAVVTLVGEGRKLTAIVMSRRGGGERRTIKGIQLR